MIKLVIQILPAAIVWQIWKVRCSSRYENQKMDSKSIIKKYYTTVHYYCSQAVNQVHSFLTLQTVWDLIQYARPVVSLTTVNQTPPSCGYLKLNTDGSSKGNPCPSGGDGGIIRDFQGRMLKAYSARNKRKNTKHRFLLDIQHYLLQGGGKGGGYIA